MIRLEQTADGWTIEVLGKHEVAVVSEAPVFSASPQWRAAEDVANRIAAEDKRIAEAVQAERARCLAWVVSRYGVIVDFDEITSAIRNGIEAPR